MSANKNPFASAAGGYATTVSFDAPAAPDRGQLIKDTTTTAFATDVIKESRQQPVLVDFWAPWCGPCRQLTPVLEKAVLEAAGAVKLVKMNIDEHPAIAGQLGVQSIPAVIAFSDGQPVDGFMGAVPESQVKDFIKRLAGKNDLITEALDEARQALEQGDLENDTAIYSAILERAPDNADAPLAHAQRQRVDHPPSVAAEGDICQGDGVVWRHAWRLLLAWSGDAHSRPGRRHVPPLRR